MGAPLTFSLKLFLLNSGGYCLLVFPKDSFLVSKVLNDFVVCDDFHFPSLQCFFDSIGQILSYFGFIL